MKAPNRKILRRAKNSFNLMRAEHNKMMLQLKLMKDKKSPAAEALAGRILVKRTEMAAYKNAHPNEFSE